MKSIISSFRQAIGASIFILSLSLGINVSMAGQELKVGILDLRGYSERFVTLTTASASDDKVVVLFRGSSQELFDKVLSGAQTALDDGFMYLAGVAWADPDSTQLGGKDCLQLYLDGVPTTGLHDAYKPMLEEIVSKGILETFSRYSHFSDAKEED